MWRSFLLRVAPLLIATWIGFKKSCKLCLYIWQSVGRAIQIVSLNVIFIAHVLEVANEHGERNKSKPFHSNHDI